MRYGGDVPQWPPLIGSQYMDHYYATHMYIFRMFQNISEYFRIFFCGDAPQWPPLIGSHYVDHYYATQPTVICLHQSLIMVFNIALRIVITTLQIYKSINENIFQLLISRFFKLASPCSYSQSIVTFVLLWIPLLLVLNFFILAFLRFLWILLLNICPTAFVGRSSWQSIRQYLPWAANNSQHILG